MTVPPWVDVAAQLEAQRPDLVRLWFALAEERWNAGAGRISARHVMHEARARLKVEINNLWSPTLARMWRARYPERAHVFEYRTSWLDRGAPGDPRQPDIFGGGMAA